MTTFNIFRLLAVTLVTLALLSGTACGQKGPLILPESLPEPSTGEARPLDKEAVNQAQATQ